METLTLLWRIRLICSVLCFLCCVSYWWQVSDFSPASLGRPFVYVFVACVKRGLDLWPLALNYLFWLWFVWTMFLLRRPGVSHQFRRREFTTYLNLSIRRGALFPLLTFQLTGTDETQTEISTSLDLEIVGEIQDPSRSCWEMWRCVS